MKHQYGHGAVWVSTMAYFMIHMVKPQSEALASFAFGIALAVSPAEELVQAQCEAVWKHQYSVFIPESTRYFAITATVQISRV